MPTACSVRYSVWHMDTASTAVTATALGEQTRLCLQSCKWLPLHLMQVAAFASRRPHLTCMCMISSACLSQLYGAK